jgi:hypothetical protein
MTRKPASRTPNYQVKVAVKTPFALPKNGGQVVEIEVKNRSRTLGTIKIGRGSLWWERAGKWTSTPPVRLRWREFAALMEERA